MIIPGATDTIKLRILGENVELPGTDRIFVTFSQCGAPVIEKTGASLEVSENVISVALTQEESLSLQNMKTGKVQVNYLVTDGYGRQVRIPTLAATFDVGEQLLRRTLP